MEIKNKHFAILLLVSYIILFIYIYFYYFLLLIENFDNNQSNEKKKCKYIYISSVIIDDEVTDAKDAKNAKKSLPQIDNKNTYRYHFYDKNYKRYMKLYGQYKNHNKYLLLKDFEDNVIGEFKTNRYNIDVITTGLYENDLVFVYKNNYKKINFYIANESDIFSIERKKESIMIYLFSLNIGKIRYNKDKKIYTIIVYEEYKIYLNLIAIAFILLNHT